MMSRGALLQVLEGTWPAAERHINGPWVFRKSPGGGKRVNAAMAAGPVTQADIAAAEDYMRASSQEQLFQVTGDAELDTILAQNGYEMIDETLIYQAEIERFSNHDLPLVTAFPVWPPLQIMRDIWEAGGIDADRVAVMERARCDKITILGRVDARAAGAVYVGLHDDCAMVHALEILSEHRRKGLAGQLMVAAAKWGAARGARQIALLVTRQNTAANALYQSLGMTAEPGYHYRIKPIERA